MDVSPSPFFSRKMSYGVKNWLRSRQHALKQATLLWQANLKGVSSVRGMNSFSMASFETGLPLKVKAKVASGYDFKEAKRCVATGEDIN